MNLLTSMRAMRPLAMMFFCLAYSGVPILIVVDKRDSAYIGMLSLGFIIPSLVGIALAGSLHQLVHRGTTALLPRAVASLRSAWLVYAATVITLVTLVSFPAKLGLSMATTGPALFCISLPLLDTRRKVLFGGSVSYPSAGGVLLLLLLVVNSREISRVCAAHPFITLVVGAAIAVLVVRREFTAEAFRKRQETPYLSDIALGLVGSEKYTSLVRFRRLENASMRNKGHVEELSAVKAPHGSDAFWFAALSEAGRRQGWLKGRPLAVALRLNALSYGLVFAVVGIAWLIRPEKYFPRGLVATVSEFLQQGTISGVELPKASLVVMLCCIPLLCSSLLMGTQKLRVALNLPIPRSTLLRCTLRHACERYAGHLISIAIPVALLVCCALWAGTALNWQLFSYVASVPLIILPLLGLAACATHFRNKLMLPLLCGMYCGLLVPIVKGTRLLNAGGVGVLAVFLAITALLLVIDLILTRRHILRADLTEDLREVA